MSKVTFEGIVKVTASAFVGNVSEAEEKLKRKFAFFFGERSFAIGDIQAVEQFQTGDGEVLSWLVEAEAWAVE